MLFPVSIYSIEYIIVLAEFRIQLHCLKYTSDWYNAYFKWNILF